ncbi:TolC family outer membrane protein [Pseudomonas aeruginosa]|uniref:TolC family outer membrane protein n=1 Tax=Pseudomonas aeruginosa TaxID=287 RepID=UPI003FCF447C
MNKRCLTLCLAAAGLGVGSAQAMSLFQIYELSLQNDPVFLAAVKEHEAGLENRKIGLAGLLPKLSYSYNGGRNNSKATFLGDATRSSTSEKRNYDSYSSALILEQPIFDYEAYSNYRKGVSQALFAEENFRGKSQELLLRVLTSYTQALFAQDQIDIARAKKKAYDEQFRQNKQLFNQGEGTRTDILEAESRYDLADAEEIEAYNEQDAALRELQSIIGQPVAFADLAPLRQSFQAFPLEPATFEAWRNLAVTNNPALTSQQRAVEIAEYEVERNRAGHLPRLSAYASSRQVESESGNTFNQRYDTNTVGIELNVPLYAGGGVSASVRQARRIKEQAEYELEGKTRETLIELRRQFNACITGARKIRAYQKALASAEALVVSTRQSVLGGERINLDELNAEQQLYNTRRDLAKARYDYLLAWVQLHFEAGTLEEQHLAQIDEVFLR